MTDHLLRSRTPISESGWELLDRETRRRLAPALAARKLVDFSGPLGWEHSATNLGRTRPLPSAPVRGSFRPPTPGSRARRAARGLRVGAERAARRRPRGGRRRPEWALDAAAHEIATAENVAVFHGWQDAIGGIGAASPHTQIALGDPFGYPSKIAEAVERLLTAGVAGPYGLALGPEQHRRVIENTEHGGYPLAEHLARIIEGPIVWAPGVQGAVVVSLRRRRLRVRVGTRSLDRLPVALERSRRAHSRGDLELPRCDARGGGHAQSLLAGDASGSQSGAVS